MPGLTLERGHSSGTEAVNKKLLMNQLWQLLTEQVDEAVVVCLQEPATGLAREKPLHQSLPLTYFQNFKSIKGIRPKKRTNILCDKVSSQ